MDEDIEKLYDLRRRVLEGEEPSAEEYKQVLDSLRGDRRSAAESKKKKGGSEVKEVDLDELFG